MSKIIFTNGCFDVLHRGHIELLKYCKTLGSVIVGLNSDQSVKKIKGDTRPYYCQKDRRFMLESCKYVDGVIIFDENTPYNLIKRLKPDIIVKGGDYTSEEVVGNDIAKVEIFNYIPGYSTTKILDKKNKEDV
jgi:D-beta-D-heptose 7-phosphate kinase / D-beta-D-heptose 1-phosphate adenosyltransferase